MIVRDIMTRGAERIQPHATLQTAAASMSWHNVGFLVVYEPPTGVVGVVTDRDITVRATAAGRDPVRTEVREVMSAEAVTCRDTDSVETAAIAMERRSIRRLVVLDGSDGLVGVVSIDDIARALGADWLAGELLRHMAAVRKLNGTGTLAPVARRR